MTTKSNYVVVLVLFLYVVLSLSKGNITVCSCLIFYLARSFISHFVKDLGRHVKVRWVLVITILNSVYMKV